jgi:hypothetical protein
VIKYPQSVFFFGSTCIQLQIQNSPVVTVMYLILIILLSCATSIVNRADLLTTCSKAVYGDVSVGWRCYKVQIISTVWWQCSATAKHVQMVWNVQKWPNKCHQHWTNRALVHNKWRELNLTLKSNYSRILLEKLIIIQLAKKFPTFYGIWRFITVFTRACHWSLA